MVNLLLLGVHDSYHPAHMPIAVSCVRTDIDRTATCETYEASSLPSSSPRRLLLLRRATELFIDHSTEKRPSRHGAAALKRDVAVGSSFSLRPSCRLDTDNMHIRATTVCSLCQTHAFLKRPSQTTAVCVTSVM